MSSCSDIALADVIAGGATDPAADCAEELPGADTTSASAETVISVRMATSG
jgi:hypothetical protein